MRNHIIGLLLLLLLVGESSFADSAPSGTKYYIMDGVVKSSAGGSKLITGYDTSPDNIDIYTKITENTYINLDGDMYIQTGSTYLNPATNHSCFESDIAINCDE